MPILGLVLILRDTSAATHECTGARLADSPDLALGTCAGHRWPAVLEADSAAGAEARVEALRAVDGIVGVDVVYADFEDLVSEES
jgi:hypothetical protein